MLCCGSLAPTTAFLLIISLSCASLISMDPERAKEVIQDLGLSSEPAFANLRIVISPHLYPPYAEKPALVLYDMRAGCKFTPFLKPDFDHYLGAYFGDEDLICVPPSCNELTILHELGHAYNSYHFGDLSEAPANAFMNYYKRFL